MEADFRRPFQERGRHQVGMDDHMTMVLPGKIGQGVFVGDDRLLDGGVSNGMHGHLKVQTVCLFHEIIDLLLRIGEEASVVGSMRIGFFEGGIFCAEAAVQRRGKTPADPGEIAPDHLPDVHGLKIDTILKRKGFCGKAHQVDIGIQGKTESFHGMDQAEPPAGQFVRCANQVFQHLIQGNGSRQVVDAVIKSLLIEPAGGFVESCLGGDGFWQFFQ